MPLESRQSGQNGQTGRGLFAAQGVEVDRARSPRNIIYRNEDTEVLGVL